MTALLVQSLSILQPSLLIFFRGPSPQLESMNAALSGQLVLEERVNHAVLESMGGRVSKCLGQSPRLPPIACLPALAASSMRTRQK